MPPPARLPESSGYLRSFLSRSPVLGDHPAAGRRTLGREGHLPYRRFEGASQFSVSQGIEISCIFVLAVLLGGTARFLIWGHYIKLKA
jgi:hypothetical protein